MVSSWVLRAVGCAAVALSGCEAAVVPTNTGLEVDLGYNVVKGYVNATTGLNTFRGIRFAAAPVGKLRWQPPQTPPTNRTVQPATAFGPICPQNYPSVPNAPFIPGNEDCLFLNVYAPPNAKGLPILFWIHGGGYGFGDGTQDLGPIVANNNKSFVAITIQYRLGAFGFASSAEIHTKGIANAGLLDQAFALQWVQKYATLFGGDPTKVTISGESAGAGSVMYHAMAKGGTLGDKFFINGIAASPYLQPQYQFDAKVPTGRYYDFASKAGCGSSGAVFECLIEKDSLTLQQASFNVSTSQAYGTWAFLPVTDDDYVRELPTVQLAEKKLNGEHVLVGNNANEGPLFVPPTINTLDDLKAWFKSEFPSFIDVNVAQVLAAYPSTDAPVNPNDPKYATDGYGPGTAVNISQIATGQQQRANNIYAEAIFVCPSYWISSAFTGNKRTAYKYQYSVPFAAHTDDIPGYFGPPTPNQGPDFYRAFQSIFANFVTLSNPSISSAIANGARSPSTKPNPASNWPLWTEDKLAQQINLNETGGVPYTVTQLSGQNVTQFRDPGLKNNITVANAYSWEGGRGKRCDFWRSIAPIVPY